MAYDATKDEQYNTRVNEINSLYDKNLNQQKSQLEGAYNQNLSDLEANRTKIAQQYQAQRNASAVDYERNRRNFNQQAMMNGLNVGAGSQAALAQNNTYQRGMAALGSAEAGSYANLDKSIADLKIKYEADVNDAIAKNDYNRAAALLDEYNNSYSRAMSQAQTLAQYGDFSGFSAIYGADAARQMSDAWAIQNPVLAYNLGRIDANRYRAITGAYPPGYSAGRSGRTGSSPRSENPTANPEGIDLSEVVATSSDGKTSTSLPELSHRPTTTGKSVIQAAKTEAKRQRTQEYVKDYTNFLRNNDYGFIW